MPTKRSDKSQSNYITLLYTAILLLLLIFMWLLIENVFLSVFLPFSSSLFSTFPLLAGELTSAHFRYKIGYKRVAWPPANEERVVREFTPQPHGQYSAPLYNPQAQEQSQQPQQYQPSAASAVPQTQVSSLFQISSIT